MIQMYLIAASILLSATHSSIIYDGSKVRRARSVVRRKEAIAIDGPRWIGYIVFRQLDHALYVKSP